MSENIKVVGTPGEFESFLDTLANYLSSPPVFKNLAPQPDLTVVHWVLGDIGMGPVPGLPVGFISPLNDNTVPYGKGGSTGGPRGVDFDDFRVPLLIVQAEHKTEPPVANKAGGGGEYQEHPGYRELMQLVQQVRAALRIEPTFGGAVATSTITEMRPMLIELDDKVYRGARVTIEARARRKRA